MITNPDWLWEQVFIQIPRCPLNFVKASVREATRDFLTRTDFWRADLTMDVVADQDVYSLDTSGEADAAPDVSRICNLYLGVDNKTPTSTSHYKFDIQEVDEVDTYVVEFLVGYIPAANETDGLKVTVSLIPSLSNSTSISTFVLDKCALGIIYGALSFLYGLSSRPWANSQDALRYEQEYTKQLAILSGEQDQQFRANGVEVAHNPVGWL